MSVVPSLEIDEFGPWFQALWNVEPFSWQTDLVAQIHADRQWPGMIDLPTGAGKTSVIDIALFLMALDAAQSPEERWMPRRIVTVVDRRVVVDQVAERATQIAHLLSSSNASNLLGRVAQRLRHLAGTEEDRRDPALLVATLRGGITRDESWLRRPDVPAILSSTIDQAGSRLLFRGYGISRSMRPIHAGLLGNDTLWILDEVHLARPFLQTLRQIRRHRRISPENAGLPNRWGIVEMSATPDGDYAEDIVAGTIDGGPRFPSRPLSDSSPVLEARLNASKPAELIEVAVPVDRAKADDKFARACVDQVDRVRKAGATAVGVIVNRVDTARRIYTKLEAGADQVHLLTGRMRPVDRDDLVQDLNERLRTSMDRSDAEPIVVVATQCIEAGADFDFDVLVTEIASIDALKQRFGRVNRGGRPISYQSVVLGRSTDLKENSEDPVYGTALRQTWEWLQALEAVDFGIRRLPQPSTADLGRLTVAHGHAPLLLDTHLDRLSQTSQQVASDLEISAWLHGTAVAAPDVHIVWRADIDENDLRRASKFDMDPMLSAGIAVCPPASTEALSVPINAARRWLAGVDVVDISDADGLETDVTVRKLDRRPWPWLVWTDGKAEVRAPSGRLSPGDVVVVPASYGGLAAGNWDPASSTHVPDVAARALHTQGRADVLRLSRGCVPGFNSAYEFPTASDLETLSDRERRRSLAGFLRTSDLSSDLVVLEIAARLAKEIRRVQITYPGAAVHNRIKSALNDQVIVSLPAAAKSETSILSGPDLSLLRSNQVPSNGETNDGASFTGATVGLDDHLGGVGVWTEHVARCLGLKANLVADLLGAGQLHDEGKRDTRFQLMLWGGNEFAAAASERALAKSPVNVPSANRRAEIRDFSKYPKGARHELASLALVENSLHKYADPDLVAHLIASHHGWCRPFAPPAIDDNPVPIVGPAGVILSDHGKQRIDAGPAQRFWDLTARYGWYQLAWLEAIVRLADHRRSEQESSERESSAAQQEARQ